MSQHIQYSLVPLETRYLKLAIIGEQIVGFAFCSMTERLMGIDYLGVIPAYQRQGIATKLLTQLQKDALQIRLEVRRSNTQAIAFYEKYGFKFFEVVRDYYLNHEATTKVCQHEDAFVYLWSEKENPVQLILAIESSCDETAVAVLRNGEVVLANTILSQIAIHAPFGGVIPEVASRNHVKYILSVIKEAIATSGIKLKQIDYIAVTQGPGLLGPLMVGVTAAQALALSLGIPLIPVNHLCGHTLASTLGGELTFPALTLLVSGGHTELIYLKNYFDYEIIGQTLDDAVGECYDKVARILGLGYPGGPIIDKLAQTGVSTFHFPRPKSEGLYNFSFSGLKSAVLYRSQKDEGNINIANYCFEFQEAALETLLRSTKAAVKDYHIKCLVLAGGVSANKRLRALVKETFKNIKVLIPAFAYCTDNAAMIARAAYLMITKTTFVPSIAPDLIVYPRNEFPYYPPKE
jgi:N6-L-threonylcarbamoyladenine synthase